MELLIKYTQENVQWAGGQQEKDLCWIEVCVKTEKWSKPKRQDLFAEVSEEVVEKVCQEK
jgi:hypothetical protein